MWKITFMKYLPPLRPKMVPKLKMLIIYWNLAHVIFQISRSRFWCQKLFLLNTTCLAQIGPKIKSAQNLLKFGTFNISNMPISILMSKMIFIKYLPPVGPSWSKRKSVQNLLKVDTFNISITSISISCQNNFYQILTNC